MMSGRLLSQDHVFLGHMYLVGEVGSTQNTGQTVERLQEAQRQDQMLENLPLSQLFEGGQLSIYSCLLTLWEGLVKGGTYQQESG